MLRRPTWLLAPMCWLIKHDDESMRMEMVPFAPSFKCGRCGRLR